MNSQKVLITGSAGVIGQALVKELESAGYDKVTAISSRDADLTDYAAAREVFERVRPDVVFHLAARVYGIMGNMSNKGIAYLDNVRINTNVIEAARAVSVRKIVAMGSTAIYSDSVRLPMSEDEIWTGPPHPSEAAYAHAKRAMLAQLDAYRDQYGIDFAFCVSTNLFGPHDKFDERFGHVIPSLISKFHRGATRGEPVVVWGTGKARRDFLFSADAAAALRLVAERHSGPINLATGTSQTIREAVEALCAISGYAGEVQWDASKPDGQHLRQYDVTRLQALGFKPRYTFKDGLARTFEWYAENVGRART